MKKVDFNLKIITPLFMGGASKQPELRTQSFNGVIRYWFRLLGGTKELENKLFGTAGSTSQKGMVKIQIEENNFKPQKFEKYFNDKGYVIQGNGINYIGFSLDQRFKNEKNENKEQREFIVQDQYQDFKITFHFHPFLKEDEIKVFLSSFWCSLYLGNFGSRSRRGFGSIISTNNPNFNEILKDFKLKFVIDEDVGQWYKKQLEYIKTVYEWKPFENTPSVFHNLNIYIVDFSKNVKEWVDDVQKGRNGYLIKEWKKGNKWQELDFMGFLLAAFRSYYKPDYDNVKGLLLGRKQNFKVERMIFGLPLNFYFSSIKKTKEFSSVRRPSPLIFKIVQFNNKNYGLFLTFIPNSSHQFNFLEENKIIDYNVEHPDFTALENFIKSLEKFKIIRKVL